MHTTRGSVKVGVLTLAISMLVVSCTSAEETGETTTTTEPTVVTTAAPATTTSTVAETTTTTPAPTTSVSEASARQFGFVEPFTIVIPPDWTRAEESTQLILYIEAGANPAVFAVSDRQSVDEWVEFLTNSPGFVATEPVAVDVGGAPGYSFDIRLSPEATSTGCQIDERCSIVLPGFTGWAIYDNLPNRVWVVDVNGRPVFIAAEAGEGAFDSFAARFQEALDTLVWGGE